MNLVPSRNLPGIFYDIDDANRPCYRDGSPVTVSMKPMFHNPSDPNETRGILLRVPESISHCGICGAPTLEHDDQHCKAVILAKFLKEQTAKMDARLLARFEARESAGDFDARRMIAVKQKAEALWNDSANWPRASWWKRLWWELRDRF